MELALVLFSYNVLYGEDEEGRGEFHFIPVHATGLPPDFHLFSSPLLVLFLAKSPTVKLGSRRPKIPRYEMGPTFTLILFHIRYFVKAQTLCF